MVAKPHYLVCALFVSLQSVQAEPSIPTQGVVETIRKTTAEQQLEFKNHGLHKVDLEVSVSIKSNNVIKISDGSLVQMISETIVVKLQNAALSVERNPGRTASPRIYIRVQSADDPLDIAVLVSLVDEFETELGRKEKRFVSKYTSRQMMTSADQIVTEAGRMIDELISAYQPYIR